MLHAFNRLQNIGIKTPTWKTPDSLAQNLLNTLQSRAFSCKLTSCSIHAAKLVQIHAKPCKVPPRFSRNESRVPREKCTATGQKRRFSTQKSRNVLFFLAKLVVPNLHVFSSICTFAASASGRSIRVSFRPVLRECLRRRQALLSKRRALFSNCRNGAGGVSSVWLRRREFPTARSVTPLFS